MSAVSGLRFNALGADDTSWLGRSFRYGIWSVMFFVGHAAGGAGIGALFGFAGAQPRQPLVDERWGGSHGPSEVKRSAPPPLTRDVLHLKAGKAE